MGKNSSIEWTHHTFNPWWGCTRVSPACKFCYAEAWSRRVGLDLWGAKRRRRFFSDSHWQEPVRWNAEAQATGKRRRVFCASMADVFEERSELASWRERLWNLIAQTPALDWLLLTKRPDRIEVMIPWGNKWPDNVWLGTTAENQVWASRRIPMLLKHAAVVRFLSCEPLLGPIDLSPWLKNGRKHEGVDWVIAGGESGHKARPMNPEWARSLRDQCVHAGIPFHFKQWGHWRPDTSAAPKNAKRVQLSSSTGAALTLVRLGKHGAGRVLDGRTWNGVPASLNGV